MTFLVMTLNTLNTCNGIYMLLSSLYDILLLFLLLLTSVFLARPQAIFDEIVSYIIAFSSATEFVTFHICEWCMLDSFFLLAFTGVLVGLECQ